MYFSRATLPLGPPPLPPKVSQTPMVYYIIGVGKKKSYYPLAKGYVLSSCLGPSVHLSIILNHEQRYIPQPQFTCEIIDTDVLI